MHLNAHSSAVNMLKLILCFVTTENLSQKAHTEKVKQRLVEHKEKRQIESKLSHVKPLGESDEDDDSAQAWVTRSRRMQEERVQAEKRVRIFTFCH
jgi:SART-1 family.